MSSSELGALELWGGVECTVNRIGDVYFDQLERGGHYDRLDDLDRVASLGIRRLRYPALWERIAPGDPSSADWRGCDEALGRIRGLGVDPIVGFVHHGSGPADTDLLDARFADRLAAYAGAFARRYPWVKRFTPVNEPLTTARFSALYGHWYPHRHDDRSFVAALVNQCRAIVRAMEAIRQASPDALLVQTEDAGSTRGTPELANQVAFEQNRRWLSLDLLAGRVDDRHPLWQYLVDHGGVDLEWFIEHRCTPEIVGLNYYVTSDRYLDHRFQRYPSWSRGGNGREVYADVDAVRVPGVGLRGHQAVLEEAWARYQRPVAITEAHLACTREEQMRWLAAAWRGARRARDTGVDVRAVTAWSLLGAFDWDSLVTEAQGHYEPGVFDVRGPTPRATALAGVVRELAEGREPSHPVLASPGWWERERNAPVIVGSSPRVPPLLIIGASGTLGRAFAIACETRGLRFETLSRRELDITDPASVRSAVEAYRPWAIVNAAGYVRVDDAERDVWTCRRVNAVGPALLAAASRRAHARFLTFSTDLVFDGSREAPYIESDPVAPLNVYGRTKVEAERRVLALNPDALVIRTSAFFGPWDQYNFVTLALNALASRQAFRAATDAIVSPTYVPDLVSASIDLLIDGASGLWHLANRGAVSWAELATRAARLSGLDPALVDACAASAFGLAARRPAYSVLGSERGYVMPHLEDSLARYVRDRERLGTAA